MQDSRISVLKRDAAASLVVFLIALPLCMGLAIASGLPPMAGLVSGVVGGVIVGALSGNAMQVTGPANSVTVLVAQIVSSSGVQALGVAVFLSGILQFLAGMLKWGRWFRIVPPSMVAGIMSGVGVIIFASQFHIMLDDSPRSSTLENLVSIPQAVWSCLGAADGDASHVAGLLGLLAIMIMANWHRLPIKTLAHLPPALAAVIATSAVTAVLDLDVKTVSLPASIVDGITWLEPAAFRTLSWDLAVDALALAVVASSESLLTASAIGKLRPDARTNYNKELVAQGTGNIVCGALGVLPVTGVIVRSSVNINAGAATRLSAVLHGLWILLSVLMVPWIFKFIPVAALAALLVYTGYRLVNLEALRELSKDCRGEVCVFAATFLSIVTVGLLPGLVVGVVISAAKLIYQITHLEVAIESLAPDEIAVTLRGSATFLNLPDLADKLESLPAGATLHVRLDELDYIDHACLDMLMNWHDRHKAQGGSLSVDWGHLRSVFHTPPRVRLQVAGDRGQC